MSPRRAVRDRVIRSPFKLPAEGSPFSGTTRVLAVDVARERADDVAEALRELICQLPAHAGILPIVDAGVSDGRPFIVTPQVTGDSLDVALAEYGPAALADALPRLQHVADALDAAAAAGCWHGALTAAEIIVSVDDTCVAGVGVAAALALRGLSLPVTSPYAAPELLEGQPATARADQYALAVIAYEWLFGRPYGGALDRPPLAPPNVDAELFARAFATATAADPMERFASCTAFVAALAESADAPDVRQTKILERTPPLEELPLHANEPEAAPALVQATPSAREGYGLTRLAAALLLGGVAGATATWLYVLGSAERPADTAAVGMVVQATTAVASNVPSGAAREVTEAEVNPPRDDVPSVMPVASPPADTAPTVQGDAGLLVHSTPVGALVTIDGVPRGTTPVAIRGLALGSRRVVVSRPGYRVVDREVVLTRGRPSRAMEIELSPLRPSRTALAADGSVVIDSRPAGASVFVDGRAVGITPIVLSVPAGPHTVRLERAGYRAVTSRVAVKAGERTRVAARLEGEQDRE